MNREPRELPMKKVGRQVLFTETNEDIPRTGEGAFVRLKDGTILHAYSEYFGQGNHDHDAANIAVIYSYDEGETWQDKKILIAKDPEALNVMSVSFLRLQNDEILLFYSRKIKETVNGIERVFGRKMVMRSSDEGKTWSEPKGIWVDKRYNHILNNDRVIQLQSGRIVVPFAKYDMEVGLVNGALMFILSDDNGHTWYDSGNHLPMPFENRLGFEEPGLYQHENGTLWCYTRTNIGCHFCLFSKDDGITWTTPAPNTFFTGARSPMLVKKVCGKYTVAVFNPISLYTGRNLGKLRGRAPLLMAVSETDGVGHNAAAFPKLLYLEDDMDNDYSYPAILDCGTYFLVGYYHSNGREKPLNNLKIVKVTAEELADWNYPRDPWKDPGGYHFFYIAQSGLPYTSYSFTHDPIEPEEYSVGSMMMHFDNACNMIVAVGSGVVNDMGKILCNVSGKPYMIVGTAPSMDGYASAASSMARDGLRFNDEGHAILV